MFLKKIKIENFRNFHKSEVELLEGLNVIVGPNNTGKSNLLLAIGFLKDSPKITINDFNKNDIVKNFLLYKDTPPRIIIRYEIEHIIDFNKLDSAFEKLDRFLKFNEDGGIDEEDNTAKLSAVIELRCELDPQLLNEYKTAMNEVNNFKEFHEKLDFFTPFYSSQYYNIETETIIESKYATSIFEVESINAERSILEISEVSRSFVRKEIAETKTDDLTLSIKSSIQDAFKSVTDKINEQILADQDSIGISNGNNEFISSFNFNNDFSNYFQYELKNSEMQYPLPIKNNGLGYNNLIYISNKIKQKKDNDYNILLIEEPEAHLHPNMQYKLIQYIEKLKKNSEKNIQNQIILTSHSPNISASTNFNNIVILNYDKKESEDIKDVRAIRLGENFEYNKVSKHLNLKVQDGESEQDYKNFITDLKERLIAYRNHLQKFLDVTRSDILFSSKVILVEGLSEKITMPLWASFCNINMINQHVIVEEVGGITLNNFLPLFLGQNKRAVCFRDCDFKYLITNNNEKQLNNISEYQNHLEYVKQNVIKREFQDNNSYKVFTQSMYGSTFETELFLENYDNNKTYLYLMKIAEIPEYLLNHIIPKSILHIKENLESIDGRTKPKIEKLLELFWGKYNDGENDEVKNTIEKLFFTVLFYDYVKDIKGDFALSLISNSNIKNISDLPEGGDDESDYIYLKVPTYIKEGLEWLLN